MPDVACVGIEVAPGDAGLAPNLAASQFFAKMESATIKVGDLMSQITLQVRVSGAKTLVFRVWVAKYLIRLASWIIGTKCSITVEE